MYFLIQSDRWSMLIQSIPTLIHRWWESSLCCSRSNIHSDYPCVSPRQFLELFPLRAKMFPLVLGCW